MRHHTKGHVVATNFDRFPHQTETGTQRGHRRLLEKRRSLSWDLLYLRNIRLLHSGMDTGPDIHFSGNAQPTTMYTYTNRHHRRGDTGSAALAAGTNQSTTPKARKQATVDTRGSHGCHLTLNHRYLGTLYFSAAAVAAWVISTMRVLTSFRLSAGRGKGRRSFPDWPSAMPTTMYMPRRSTAEIWADFTCGKHPFHHHQQHHQRQIVVV